MELLQTVILVLLLYLTVTLIVSGIRALFSLRKGRKQAKMVFKDMFWGFFLELVNPFNWF